MQTYDVIICGGGIIGPSLGYGIAQSGASVLMLDDGDEAFRAARGNFGLVWYTTKGLGCQPYAEWTQSSVAHYPEFSQQLIDDVDINIELQQNGGLEFCLSDDEANAFKADLDIMREQSPGGTYTSHYIDRSEINDYLGSDLEIGAQVVGAVYGACDGHLNPLKLVRALHTGFQKHGGLYQANNPVLDIMPNGDSFRIKTQNNEFACKRVVIAAGHGIPKLAPAVGLDIPIIAERGQILVTERIKPLFSRPLSGLRQTDEGTILIGASNEDVGYDIHTTAEITSKLASRAVASFPILGQLNLVRTWSALRVLTPDHNPVYDQSKQYPGAFAATSHSAVTLAASNVNCASDWILEDRAPDVFPAFSSERFHV